MSTKTKQTDSYDNGEIDIVRNSAIIELLKVKPILYEVCEWTIDPITKKPVRKCRVLEPVNAPKDS